MKCLHPRDRECQFVTGRSSPKRHVTARHVQNTGGAITTSVDVRGVPHPRVSGHIIRGARRVSSAVDGGNWEPGDNSGKADFGNELTTDTCLADPRIDIGSMVD